MSRPVHVTAREAARLGARPRPRESKPRPPQRREETALMRASLALLKLRSVWHLRLNAGGGLREWRGRMVPVRMAPEGTSDLMLLINGRAIFVELKSPAGRQRPSQKAFAASVEAAGGVYRLIRDLAALVALLLEHGVE